MPSIVSWIIRSARCIPCREHTMMTRAFMAAVGIDASLINTCATIKAPSRTYDGLMECFANRESPMDWR